MITEIAKLSKLDWVDGESPIKVAQARFLTLYGRNIVFEDMS